jgi:hypothetical protein
MQWRNVIGAKHRDPSETKHRDPNMLLVIIVMVLQDAQL